MYPYVAHLGSPWVAEALARVLAFERGGVPITPLDPPADPKGRDDVLDAMSEHRVVTVLAPYLDALGIDGGMADAVRVMRQQYVTAGLRLQVDTATVSSLLSSIGVKHLVAKGAALSAMTGRSPVQRGAGDVDVWVRQVDVARAEAELHAHGWSRYRTSLPSPSDGWRWRLLLAVGNELPQKDADKSSVDLHWRLTQIAGEGIPRFEDAYERSVPVPSVGDGVRTLCATDALCHLAQHARKDVWPALRYVVDVVRVIDRCDSHDVLVMASRLPNVALALTVADIVTGTTVEGWRPDSRTRALALEAWRSCLGLRSTLAHRQRTHGVQGLKLRARFEWWQLRSVPTWTARASWAYRLALPLQVLVRPSTDRV